MTDYKFEVVVDNTAMEKIEEAINRFNDLKIEIDDSVLQHIKDIQLREQIDTSTFDGLIANFGNFSNDLYNRFEDFNNTLRIVDTRIDQFQTVIIDELEKVVDSIQVTPSTVTDLTPVINKVKSSQSMVLGSIARSKLRIEAVISSIKVHFNKLGMVDIRKSIADLSNKNDKINASIISVGTEVKKLFTSNDKIMGAIANIELDSLSKNISSLSDEFDLLSKDIANSDSYVVGLGRKIEQLAEKEFVTAPTYDVTEVVNTTVENLNKTTNVKNEKTISEIVQNFKETAIDINSHITNIRNEVKQVAKEDLRIQRGSYASGKNITDATGFIIAEFDKMVKIIDTRDDLFNAEMKELIKDLSQSLQDIDKRLNNVENTKGVF